MNTKITYQRYSYQYNNLNFRWHKQDEVITHGDGYYLHYDGWCVRVNFTKMPGTDDAYTCFNMNYKGVSYSKYYNQQFTERGMMKICSAFIKEVMDGKLKNLKSRV